MGSQTATVAASGLAAVNGIELADQSLGAGEPLVTQLTTLMKRDYDWTDEARGIDAPTMLVIGDADGLPPRHAVELFELFGGGLRDAHWDRSGMTKHRLSILPGATHDDINVAPELGATVAGFLDRRDDATARG